MRQVINIVHHPNSFNKSSNYTLCMREMYNILHILHNSHVCDDMIYILFTKLSKYYSRTVTNNIDNVNIAKLYIRYGLDLKNIQNTNDVFIYAISTNNWDLINFWIPLGVNNWDDAYNSAAMYDNVKLMKIIDSKYPVSCYHALQLASYYRNANSIKYLKGIMSNQILDA